MKRSEVLDFRLAAYQADVIDTVCSALLAENRWEIRTAISDLAVVIDRNNRLSNLHTDSTLHPTDSHAARIQTMMLWLVDEMRLLQLGSNQSYYPSNSYEIVTENIRQLDPDLNPIADMLDLLMPFWQNGLFLADRSLGLDDEQSDMVGMQAIWRDVSSDEMHKCVELLLFASHEEWEKRSQKLADLTLRIAEDPSISLSTGEADEVTWGLQGADFIFDPAGSGIEWSTTYSTIRWELHNSSNNRPKRLQEVREDLAKAARFLTPDQGTAATRRLSSVIEGPQGWIR